MPGRASSRFETGVSWPGGFRWPGLVVAWRSSAPCSGGAAGEFPGGGRTDFPAGRIGVLMLATFVASAPLGQHWSNSAGSLSYWPRPWLRLVDGVSDRLHGDAFGAAFWYVLGECR